MISHEVGKLDIFLVVCWKIAAHALLAEAKLQRKAGNDGSAFSSLHLSLFVPSLFSPLILHVLTDALVSVRTDLADACFSFGGQMRSLR